MIAAVTGLAWAVFAAVLLACAGGLARVLWLLLRRLKVFKAEAAEATERLNEAMNEVNGLLREATEGVERLQARHLRDR